MKMDKKKIELAAIPILIIVLALTIAGSLKKASVTGQRKPPLKGAAEDITRMVKEMAEGRGAGKAAQKKLPLSELTWGRDPFTMQKIAGGEKGLIHSLSLMGISWSSQKNAYSAIINNEIVTIGSRIGAFTVTDIQKDRATVSDKNKSYDLFLNR